MSDANLSRWAVVGVAVAALALGGCGTSDDGAGASGAAPPAAAQTPTKTAQPFDDLDLCSLSQPAERAAALGEAAAEAEQKNGAANRGCQATADSGKAYLIYLVTETPIPALEYYDEVRKDADGQDISGLGEKAFSSTESDTIMVQALAKGYVISTSIVYYEDRDRPSETDPTVTRLKVLTEQVIGRL